MLIEYNKDQKKTTQKNRNVIRKYTLKKIKVTSNKEKKCITKNVVILCRNYCKVKLRIAMLLQYLFNGKVNVLKNFKKLKKN